jgi:hypothetical protein
MDETTKALLSLLAIPGVVSFSMKLDKKNWEELHIRIYSYGGWLDRVISTSQLRIAKFPLMAEFLSQVKEDCIREFNPNRAKEL